MYRVTVLLVIAFALGGCADLYTLVRPGEVKVAHGALKVTPSIAWNRAPRDDFDLSQEETWTQNGLTLDAITFIVGIGHGEAIAKQRSQDDRQVPAFQKDMSPQDLVSMVESYYRLRRGALIFETTSVAPTPFLGSTAIGLDFSYVKSDEVKRRGRSLIAVRDGKLYLVTLEAAALHYFDAALPAFEALVRSASIG